MCKSCVGKCREIITAEQPAEIECPVCDGDGCSECDNGRFKLTECPSAFIGAELIQDIRIVNACEHHLPVAGGLLDQSAWWFNLKEQMEREENLIRQEQRRDG